MLKDPFSTMLRKKRLAARWRRFAAACRRPWQPTRIDTQRGGPPNLLTVAVDTLRYDHLGLAGYPRDISPRLDKLAGDGLCFDDVTAPAPWTLPSFTSSLCGTMPSLHRAWLAGKVRNMDQQPPSRLDPGTITLARHLSRLGYRTAAFYSNQFFAFGLAESFDEHAYFNVPADQLAEIALDWIRRHGDRPFFCFVLLNDPHEPTTPPPERLAPVLAELAEQGVDPSLNLVRSLAGWGDEGGPTSHLGRQQLPLTENTQDLLAVKLALYDATIAFVDHVIGSITDQLAAWQLDSNTLLTVYADHGEEFLDHLEAALAWDHDPRSLRAIGHGHTHFQELLHVPWLAWGPGVPAGIRHQQPVSLCDLAPTIVEWLGVDPLPLPTQASEGLVGHSLAREITAETIADPKRLLLAEAIAFGPDLVALRVAEWKMIATRGGSPLALFNLAVDPGEQSDVQQQHPDRVTELLDHLATWRAGTPDSGGKNGGDDKDGDTSWDDVSDTVRQRLRDLGYSE